MIPIIRTFILSAAMLLSACSTYSSNMRIGNDMSYASLRDQREASQSIKVLQDVPANAQVLGSIDAARCHQSFVETSPEEQTVLLDLQIAAYVRGADAIASVNIEMQSGLAKNCWYVLDGKAIALRLSRPQ